VWHYAAHRLASALISVGGVLLVAFFVSRILPGDPVRLLAGLEASTEDLMSVRVRLGLEDDLASQVLQYFVRMSVGDLGVSIRTSRDVLPDVLGALVHSVLIIAVALGLSTLISVSLGLAAARSPGGPLDRALTVVATVGMSIPPYFMAIVLITVFAVELNWFPATGSGSIEHVILPIATLVLGAFPPMTRLVRSFILEERALGYVATARAKGLSESVVLRKHILANASVPTINLVSVQAAYMLGGIALVEWVYAYPGIGWLMVDSISYRDFPVLQGAVFVVAVTVISVSFVADMSYVIVNPKLRHAVTDMAGT
jgi:ABC-type dipeptide/oligopeptide/nickel transport system permease component